MSLVEQHRTQTILGLIHVGIILFGSIGVGVILKAMGYSDGQEMAPLVGFVRNWGFILILIPVFWVLATIWMELHHSWHSKRVTLVSGVLLLAGLIWFFVLMAARASSVLVHMGNQ